MSSTDVQRIGDGHLKVGAGQKYGVRRERRESVIVDDYQSQGYGNDSEMDAQDMMNEFNDANGTMYIEGESVGDVDGQAMF